MSLIVAFTPALLLGAAGAVLLDRGQQAFIETRRRTANLYLGFLCCIGALALLLVAVEWWM
jgi:hypothetical protein